VSLHQLDRRGQPFQIDNVILGVDGRSPSPSPPTRVLSPGMAMLLLRGRHRDGVQAVLRILHLPDPPQAVHRAVMEVEERVAGRGGRIAARVDAVDVVAGGMDLSASASIYHEEELTPQG
jgi:hypothetical protein